jgi:sec-independent protein translocase protein TatB
MLDIGWSELLLIGVVALIVVGPKDLPKMFRTLGQFTGKARAMARDFQRAMDDAAKDTGVQDVARDLREATSGKSMGLDGVSDAVRDLKDLKKWDPSKPAAKKPPKAAVPDPAAPEAEAKPARGPATAKLAEDQAARTEAMRAAADARRAKAAEKAAEKAAAPVPDPAAPLPPEAPAASGKPGA